MSGFTDTFRNLKSISLPLRSPRFLGPPDEILLSEYVTTVRVSGTMVEVLSLLQQGHTSSEVGVRRGQDGSRGKWFLGPYAVRVSTDVIVPDVWNPG